MITAVLAKLLSKKRPKLIQSRHMGMTRFKDDSYHRFLYKNIDMMHAVTKKVQEQLEKFIPEDIRPKLEMVYLGTQASDIDENIVTDLKNKYKQNNEFIVGIVGRIEEGKGQYKLIEAIAKLKESNIKVLIVGSAMQDSYLNELEDKVKSLGLQEKVVFTGFTKNVHEYMQIFDVNVLATENETFGLVVIETMVNKVPIVATGKGGPLEIIEDGIDGLLFDGTSEDLSKKIQMLYKDKELVNNLANAGYSTVSNKFSRAKQSNKLYEVII